MTILKHRFRTHQRAGLRKGKRHINKADGTLNNTFNGKVAINIFDKRLNKKTLNNIGVLTQY
ncbi:hypothetical protein EJ377_03435 [Chryseobacterium arthrosphaerae]|uniref:Uncharacterized protein n=1 Tax=Chryseobacterium arthrosphaerae TaxID=651561 RepID=A0A3S0Q7G5_9FLAO|nr:hypothetical protein EJ377_03435 [Chryseobacterium arthrosphaerae]